MQEVVVVEKPEQKYKANITRNTTYEEDYGKCGKK